MKVTESDLWQDKNKFLEELLDYVNKLIGE